MFELLEAALSVPIRFKLTTEKDELTLMAMHFSESVWTTAATAAADSFWKFAEKTSGLFCFRTGLGARPIRRQDHGRVRFYRG